MRTGVILDVDGTLVDTNHFHAVAWWYAFRERGRTVPMADLHRLIGMGATELISEVAGEYDEAVDDAYSKHYRSFRSDMAPLPGAAELLRELHRRGMAVVLATSGKPEDVEAQRKAIDADDAIDEVVSAGDADEAKPSPEIFELALERAGLARTAAVVVGDTVWDGRAAAAAGLPFIGVRSGGIPEADLRDAGAAAVFAHAGELCRALDRQPLAALLSPRA